MPTSPQGLKQSSGLAPPDTSSPNGGSSLLQGLGCSLELGGACGLGRGGSWCGRGLWSEKGWSLELGVNFTQNRKPRN